MKRLLCIFLLLPLVAPAARAEPSIAVPKSALAVTTATLAGNGDEKILAAHEAFRNGERVKLARVAQSLGNHELAPWVDYWQLRLMLEDTDAAKDTTGIRQFLVRNGGTYLAERLRSDWLKQLGKQRQWGEFSAAYPALLQPDLEIVCAGLQARLVEQHDRTALDEARPLWFAATELADSCQPLMEALRSEGRLSDEDVWTRLRSLLEVRKIKPARATAAYLPTGVGPDTKTLDGIAEKPKRYLDKLPATFAESRLKREMALYALQRLARQDPLLAAAQLKRFEANFAESDRAYAWSQIAWIGAQNHQPEALGWYTLADKATLTEEQQVWKVRAALRASDWPAVNQTIDRMPLSVANQPDWIYWKGRALVALSRSEEAPVYYWRIASQPTFYGNLAAEELGLPIALPPRAAAPSDAELEQAATNPGLRRALALMRIELRNEGVREWNWTVRDMSDRQLLAAAELARRALAFDRAINAAERTVVEHDYSLRYLAPFRDSVDPKARELSLDNSWVYGLMRQESRFVTQARSGVGAKGLMQLMPATARFVAKKIGLSGFRASQVNDMDVNVTLGTSYLRMVLDALDNQPVLASAAYNAGPARARKWRGERTLEGAIYVETIPFNETRDYVKKVMNNAVYYAMLFQDKPQSIKTRLGVVGPRKGSDSAAEDLP
jgi:soluble lytic murein transglycosylase